VMVLNYNGQRFLKNCFESLRACTYPNFKVMMVDNLSTENDVEYTKEISELIESAAKKRGTGIAKRTPSYLEEKILTGRAVVAKTDTNKLVGFCYIESWGHQDFVATSGLIVKDDYRGVGVSKKIKEEAFNLSRNMFPKAKLFSITTSIAVMKLNMRMGYKPVILENLTDDEQFWKGCQGCVNYPILQQTERKHCLCTGLLYDPEKSNNSNNETKAFKIYSRWFKYKLQVLSRYAKPKKAFKRK